MIVERHLTIPGVLAKIHEACEFVVAAAEAASLDERSIYYCQMAIDEWCTNIIEHGYHEHAAQGQIDIECEIRSGKLTITVTDEGPAFDPRELSTEEPSKLLEEREPGGLGWFFINKFMDEVHYARVDGHNCLTMIRRSQVGEPEKVAEPTYPSEPLANQEIWVIHPSGRLDAASGQMLSTTLNAHIEAAHTRLVISMNEVNYISSGGLKVLVAAWRRLQKSGGLIVLSGMQPKVRKVFEISGFDSLFTITASVDDAANNMKSNK